MKKFTIRCTMVNFEVPVLYPAEKEIVNVFSESISNINNYVLRKYAHYFPSMEIVSTDEKTGCSKIHCLGEDMGLLATISVSLFNMEDYWERRLKLALRHA